MRKRTTTVVTLEAACVIAEVKEIASGGYAHARALAHSGMAAEDALVELLGDAEVPELRLRAAKLRGAIDYARLLCANLTTSAARLEQVATILEAAHAFAPVEGD